MEYNEFIRRAEERKAQNQNGRATNDWGVLNYSESGERKTENMPTYGNEQKTLQDPATGKPFFTLGVDALDDPDSAGLA